MLPRNGMRATTWFLGFTTTLLTTFALACSDSDVGSACPDLQLEPQNIVSSTGDGVTVSQEVVETNPAFPCDSLLCIATGGRPGYCSKKCRNNHGCPDGFECRQVQTTGPFAGTKFCAWRACTTGSDCGGGHCCAPLTGSSPLQHLCALDDEPTCS